MFAGQTFSIVSIVGEDKNSLKRFIGQEGGHIKSISKSVCLHITKENDESETTRKAQKFEIPVVGKEYFDECEKENKK